MYSLEGNKCDLAGYREVTTQEGIEMAKSFKCPFFETSAKDRINIEESFFELVRQLKPASKQNKKGKKNCIIL